MTCLGWVLALHIVLPTHICTLLSRLACWTCNPACTLQHVRVAHLQRVHQRPAGAQPAAGRPHAARTRTPDHRPGAAWGCAAADHGGADTCYANSHVQAAVCSSKQLDGGDALCNVLLNGGEVARHHKCAPPGLAAAMYEAAAQQHVPCTHMQGAAALHTMHIVRAVAGTYAQAARSRSVAHPLITLQHCRCSCSCCCAAVWCQVWWCIWQGHVLCLCRGCSTCC